MEAGRSGFMIAWFCEAITLTHFSGCTQVQRINEISSGGPRIALLANLLNQEIQLLNAVEKKHFTVRKHVAALGLERKLDKMGEPVKWVGYKSTNLNKWFFSTSY